MRKKRNIRMAAAVMSVVLAGGTVEPIPALAQTAAEAHGTGNRPSDEEENDAAEQRSNRGENEKRASASNAQAAPVNPGAYGDKHTDSNAEASEEEIDGEETLVNDMPGNGQTGVSALRQQEAGSNGEVFEADGLTYQILSAEDQTVQVGDGSTANRTASGAVSIPDSVTYEGVSYKVTEIGDYAFFRNSGITELTLPESLERIGSSAFGDLQIQELAIPDSVTEIGESALSGSTVSKVTVGAGIEELPRECFHLCANLIQVEFSNGLIKIGERAFNGCSSLVTASIPSTVEEIGKEAFWGCDALTGVSLGEGSRLTVIGAQAFQFDENLKEINLPSGLKTIGESAFSNCSALKEIGLDESSKLTELGSSAFASTQISSFYVPETLTSMGERPFHSCKKLTQIQVAEGNANWTSEEGVLYNKDKTELIQYPARKKGDTFQTPESVKTIDRYAFYGNNALESIHISQGAEQIGEFAFQDADKLETVDMADSVTSIGRLAFYKCPNLTEIHLSGGIETLTTNLIYGCESLEELVIPAGVRKLEKNVVSSCENLTMVTLLSPQLDSIAEGAFSGLSGVTFQVQNDAVKALLAASGVAEADITSEGKTPPEELDESFTADGIYYQVLNQPSGSRAGTVQVGNGGFDSNSVSYGQNLEIPETVEHQGVRYTVVSIGENAFSTMMGGTSSLGSVIIPKTVTSIGNSAFYENSALTQVTFAEGGQTVSIGANAFDSCVALKKAVVPEGVQIASIGEKAFFGCRALTEISLQGLKTLESGAFSGCQALKSISLPASLTAMGDRPFDGCIGLSQITVEEGNSSYYSIEGVLFETATARLVLYPGAKKGEEYTTPQGTKEIGDYSFANTSNLNQITIGNGVETVGANSFQKTSAERIVLADSVTAIGRLAFYNCENLAEVQLPKGLKVLTGNLFYNCPSLESLTLPGGLTEIQSGALSSMSSLKQVTLESQLEGLKIASGAFGGLESARFTVRTEAVKQLLVSSGVAEQQIQVEEAEIVNPAEDFSVDGIYYKVLTAPDETGEGGTVQAGDGKNALAVSGEVRIPETVNNGNFRYKVTVLGSHAFANSAGLTSLTLPAGLTAIEDNGVTESGLTELTIPKTVTRLGVNAVAGNRKLQTIRFEADGSLKTMENGALSDNTVLTSIEQIPNTVEELGTGTMGWNYALTSVTFEPGAALRDLGDNTFFRAESLASITLPASVETIGKDAFYHCVELAKLEFENQEDQGKQTDLSRLTSIGENAFYLCGSLTGRLKLGAGLTEIPGGAFAGTGFEQVELQEGLKSLGVLIGDGEEVPVGAFEGCEGLAVLQLPQSLTQIGKNSFKDCSSLSQVEILAEQGVQMGANAFLNNEETAVYRVYSGQVAGLLETASLIGKARIADASSLKTLLEQAKTYQKTDYTEESFQALTDGIARGEEALADKKALQTTLDERVQTLEEAIKHLKKQGEEENGKVEISLSGNPAAAVGTKLPFLLSMADLNRTAIAELTFEVEPADLVKDAQVTGLNGFAVLGGTVDWKEENGKLTGHAIFSYLGGEVRNGLTSETPVQIGRISFADGGKLGTVAVRITSARVVGYDTAGNAVDQTPVLDQAEASTQITSPYDVNYDGTVDLLDIATVQRWYQAVEGSEEWGDASFCDVTKDGVIDIEDLVAILNHYTS